MRRRQAQRARSRGLSTVRRLASNEADRAMVGVAQTRQQLSAAESRLEMLERYLEEYGTDTGTSTGMIAVDLTRRSAFVGRICEAIREQSQEIARLRSDLAGQTADWEAARTRSDALESLEAARERADRAHRQDVEQRADDELGTRGHRSALKR